MSKLKIFCLFTIILLFLLFIHTALKVLFGDAVDRSLATFAILTITDRIMDWFFERRRLKPCIQ